MKLNINSIDLRMAVEDTRGEANYYLDKNTGKIIVDLDSYFYIDGSSLEREIEEDFYDESFPDNPRYIEIPSIKAIDKATEDFYDMQIFIDAIDNFELKKQLQNIVYSKIDRQDALNKFLAIMNRKPERKQWLIFRESREEKRTDEFIDRWLKSQNIET
jgi:hypothetical protein